MALKEKLQEDWKQALKAKDKFKANTISMARSAILLVEKTDGRVLDDDEVIGILSKEIKQKRDSICEFEKGNRQDLIDKEKAEIDILLSYLPQQLTKEEVSEIVSKAAYEVGANSIKDMGKVMSAVMPKVKGRADGKLVSQIVKEYLNK
ncbi:glutamyl-tRNA(Gln) amidotransferase subunit E [Clostridium acetireducens DSM 10703]|jgi:uncharacterized protein YqeY|uniref:Glutamyl-tRNA(Gln) amidotransferase subunit E n=1 Tax=Clostridium acetireducens DSM 10703 TaxID=1121290 RepID=A0A1E8F1W1_9CLOT|nr:GatB/YqeY domain-containing protein [Clostridium acetireducens]OFI07184.1 glutamyl-tRNA(Gln) amidotransferase subunit E [Clostridium acetireducens DSM 10703]